MTDGKRPLFAGIEAGGTKFVLAVGHSPGEIIARHVIPTTQPNETFDTAANWFSEQGEIAAIGIASFGPVKLDRNSKIWGYIAKTPKEGWSGKDFAGYFASRLNVPVGFDTDVNGAALAEYHFGAGQGKGDLAYITVGTGIGGGLIIDGKSVHGVAHPEMGHILPRRHPTDQEFEGICQHHGDCLEGLASGPAIQARWGKTLSELPYDHEAHEIIAFYLGQLCHNLLATTATETIVLGGGVMQTMGLRARVVGRTADLGAGYLPGKHTSKILVPALGQDSGIVGALKLAVDAQLCAES